MQKQDDQRGLRVVGGVALRGQVRAAGAKNAITKLLIASLLSEERAVFHNVPDIVEVGITVNLCKEVGSVIHWDRQAGTLEIQTKCLKTAYVTQQFCGANRVPILMLGALLGRTDEAVIVPSVGGCAIGGRPVDFHIQALESLGASVEYRSMPRGEGAYFAQAPEGLKGGLIQLPFPSIGATENAILAAANAKGVTVIKNAAVEPEVIDLILFLQKSGVIISLDADRTIRVERAIKTYPVEHSVIPDRVEVACMGMAGIATGGEVFVEGAQHVHIQSFLRHLLQIGGSFEVKDQGILFRSEGPLRGNLHLETGVHPGFLTDWQQPFVALLTQAQGTTIVHETIYEKRFGYVKTLNKMGANLAVYRECLGPSCRFMSKGYHHSLVVRGPTPLVGLEIAIPDLRAGFAYVLAALIASGESLITGLNYLNRGYERLEQKLLGIGAQIESVEQVSSNGTFHG